MLPEESCTIIIIIIIMYIHHAFINVLSAHMIHINLNILYTCTDVEHSPTKTIYIKYFILFLIIKNKKKTYHGNLLKSLVTMSRETYLFRGSTRENASAKTDAVKK